MKGRMQIYLLLKLEMEKMLREYKETGARYGKSEQVMESEYLMIERITNHFIERCNAKIFDGKRLIDIE